MQRSRTGSNAGGPVVGPGFTLAEVLVVKDKFFVIREREDYDDLIRGEIIPDFLKE